MSCWVRPATRWAIYLRDGLRCSYCRVTLAELLADLDENFLTLDHVKPRSKGGKNEPRNLVTCCYSCNQVKGRGSVKTLGEALGVPPSTLRSRLFEQRRRPIEQHRMAARLLLGQLPGLPGSRVATAVIDHDWLVKRQWGDNPDSDYWFHLQTQRTLFCGECDAPISARNGRFVGVQVPRKEEPEVEPALSYGYVDVFEIPF